MEKRLTMLFASLFLCLGMALAQTNVSGTVVSADDGEPIVGASIRLIGTNFGAVTDVNGKFSLTPREGHNRIEVTYIGFESQTLTLKQNMRITLHPDQKSLDEVIVVAYGTQKRSAFTGSAAVVGSDEIGKVQVTNAVDALKGKAAGVQINTASGQPGSTPTIRIRGVNSINAGNAPLIVLDGSPYDGDLNSINPADVESMTVLKDAASTALYGARGGNGVILITTKGAKKGQGATVTVDAKWGSNSKAIPQYELISSPAKYYELWWKGLYNYAVDKRGADAATAWKWANDNLINSTDYGLGYNVYTYPEGQAMIGTNGKLNPNATLGRLITHKGNEYYLTPDDWEDEMYNNSLRQEYTISVTGSNDKANFYGSANYLSNDGIAAASDYKRFTGRLKADYQAKDWLKVSANMSYGHYDRNALGDDGSSGSSGNAFAFSNIAPIYPMYIRDGKGNIIYDETSRLIRYDYGDGTVTPFRPYLSQGNPISANLLDTNNTEGNTFNGTGEIEIRLPWGFTFTSINNVYLNEWRYTSTTNPFFGQYASSNGAVTKEHERAWSYNYQQRLNWRKLFGKNEFEVMLGHEYYRYYGYDLWANKTNQFSVFNKELAGAVVPGSANSSFSDYNTESWLSRFLYNYEERYYASLSLMREASSNFSKEDGKWWGTFWSVGAGWLINKEKFMEGVTWLDELKLKASYGENGNDDIGSYQYTPYFAISNSNNNVSLTPSSLGNPNISWEKNGKFNIGFDFAMFNSRLTGSIEYYNNRTNDMLSWVPLPPSYGYTGYYDNVGNMVNRGVEIDLHYDVIRTKDFTWNVYANMTTNHNEITKLAEERKSWYDELGRLGYSSGSYFYTEGESRYTYYTRRYAGVDPKTGESQFWKNIYEYKVTGQDADGNDIKETIYYDVDGKVIDDPDNYSGEKRRKIIGEEKTTTYNDGDYYLCGDVLPDVYGGFGTNITWKGFDFSADFQYQIGGLVYDGSYAGNMGFSTGHAIHVDMLDAWSADNPDSNIPRMQFNDSYMASSSDRFLTDASYLTLANVTVGYTLPKSFVRKIGLQKVRFYAVGDNIWTWSKRQGLDPRQSITGSTTNSYYKPIRTISGGITVTF
ncbi:MAG: TonB-dependent receptor [Prevotella sp.]|nr:TonB-dependent receptor [Prevotella sp.]